MFGDRRGVGSAEDGYQGVNSANQSFGSYIL